MKFNYLDFNNIQKKVFFNGFLFKYFFNIDFLYNFIIYFNSFYRICKSSQKSRSFINFSTRKIYKQKGTGRARCGSLSSPTRIKGSKCFPNFYFINYKKKFNHFSYKLVYFIIYSNIFLNNFFSIVEDLFFLEVKLKLLFFFFNFCNLNNNIIFITLKIEKNFFLSLNNFKFLKIFYFFNFNPLILLKFNKIFITRSCIENFFYG